MNVIPQGVKDGFVRLTKPVVGRLVRAHVRPNTITTLGAAIVLGSAVAFGLSEIRLGGLLLLVSGLFDILDGQVARVGGSGSTFGAFYDSTLDRVGEAALFGGIALHFMRNGLPPAQATLGVMLAITALAASLLVSYTRARAEGLGLECKVGIAARAERFLLLGAPTLLLGNAWGGRLLFWIVAVLALVTAITVIQRIIYVARTANAAPARRTGAPRQRDTLPGRASLRKGT
ncbi:MAG TPA: CDP-alcohol phosphatidyltransferase family protein [Gaiellales bacterium]|nr:CDP-alcohol phosphatidyltransferase family protein [Gaiellales bacterium]